MFVGPYIKEDYEKWNSGKWIHYSLLPQMTINPKQLHRDPSGIYFFPEKFKPLAFWTKMPYRFTAKVNNLKILDLSKLSLKDIMEILKAAGEDDNEYIHKSKKPVDAMWEVLSDKFSSNPSKFNKFLRNLGYDAVFDDTGSILSTEVQLIVLDPGKLKDYTVTVQSTSGYEDAKKVFDWMIKNSRNYGVTVETSKLAKKRNNWGGTTDIKGALRFSKGEEYVVWEINVIGSRDWDVKKGIKVPDRLSIHLKYDSKNIYRQIKTAEMEFIGTKALSSSGFKDVVRVYKEVMQQVFK